MSDTGDGVDCSVRHRRASLPFCQAQDNAATRKPACSGDHHRLALHSPGLIEGSTGPRSDVDFELLASGAARESRSHVVHISIPYEWLHRYFVADTVGCPEVNSQASKLRDREDIGL